MRNVVGLSVIKSEVAVVVIEGNPAWAKMGPAASEVLLAVGQ